MADFTDPRLKRILFRSTHRGMKETDTLLGGFAAERLAGLDGGQIARFEALLDESDTDLFDWISEKCPVPEHLDTDVMAMLRAYRARL